jgi:hypothetical protein
MGQTTRQALIKMPNPAPVFSLKNKRLAIHYYFFKVGDMLPTILFFND